MTREQFQQIKQPRTGLNCYVGPKNTRGYRKYSISIMLNLPIKLELTEILECFRIYLNRAEAITQPADLDSLDNVQTVLPNHAARETREELLEDTLNAKGTEDSTGYPGEGLEVETVFIEESAEITAEEWPEDRHVEDELQDI